MKERDVAVRADVLVLRSLAQLEEVMLDRVMVELELNPGLISQRRQAQIRHQLYDGVARLAVRLGGSWDEALMLTRSTASQGSQDPDEQVAYERLVRDTEYLYSS